MKIARIGIFFFSLPFASFGTGFFIFLVYPELSDWIDTNSWQPVQASLVAVKLETNSSSDSTTYKATATYQYFYNGQGYTNNRVALSTEADNIGSFQEDIGRQLEQSYQQKHPIQVWVNPENPQDAVINREMRWGLLSIKMIFVVAFGGIGFVLMYAAVTSKPGNKQQTIQQVSDPQPWLTKKDWASPVIRSGAKKSVWMMWGFAIFWNAFSILAATKIPEVLQKGEYGILVILLFNLVGLGLLVFAIVKTLEWRRFGTTPLTMDPHPGAIGGHVGGEIDVKLPYQSERKFKVTLSNIHSYVSGSGKNRSRHEKVKWQDMAMVNGVPSLQGTRLSFRFDVPDGLRASEEHSDSYNKWNLGIEADLPGVDLNRQFEIPVFQTSEKSRFIDDSHSATDSDVMVQDLPVQIQQEHGKTELNYPPGRTKGMAIGLSAIGSIFLGIGIFLGYKYWTDSNPEVILFIMGSLFFLVGLLLDVGGIYTLINALEVTIDISGVKTVRKVLGIPLFQRKVGRNQLRDIQIKRGAQAGNTVFYSIFLITMDNRRIKIGESFVGSSTAEQVAAQIKHWLDLR